MQANDVRSRTRRADRPETILEAAEAVLRRSGARGVTIDAVAAEAKLSKGGVLHHYASKDALIRAMVGRKLRRLREGIERHEALQPEGPTASALAVVANARETYGEEDGFPRALLVASADSPDGLADFRGFLHERLDQMTELEGRPGAGSIFIFAILGMMVGRTLGFHDLEGSEADRVFDALEAFAGGLREA